MNKDALMYAINHPEELPEFAYTSLPSDKKQVIIVKKGVHGYFPYQAYNEEIDAKLAIAYGNANIAHATEEQVEALTILSMRGA